MILIFGFIQFKKIQANPLPLEITLNLEILSAQCANSVAFLKGTSAISVRFV